MYSYDFMVALINNERGLAFPYTEDSCYSDRLCARKKYRNKRAIRLSSYYILLMINME